MLLKVSGLVLRETKMGDYDKAVTLLTKEYGRISVSAKGSKSLKSKMLSGTQLFSYGSFNLYYSKGKYSVNDVDLQESFYNIRQRVDGFALAAYIAELAGELATENEDSGGLLPLTLNAFHLIANSLREPNFIKAVYELRAFSLMGFCPNLIACSDCSVYECDEMYFSFTEGKLWCKECFDRLTAKPADSRPVSPSVLYAARFVVFSEDKKIFSFKLNDEAMREFSAFCECYAVTQAGHGFKTLDFYKDIN